MGSSYVWWLNIIIGIVGGWLGGALLGSFLNLGEIAGISIGGVVTGIIGAVLLIFIIRLIKK
ncbi:MAG: GlsB/YeaQ/YmgE family stress response membrane protein [Bacteroidales bacterium]|nr:GlsB/YeaQ/YmgE family stress response membrane protein [Bacteroidales bacterium]